MNLRYNGRQVGLSDGFSDKLKEYEDDVKGDIQIVKDTPGWLRVGLVATGMVLGSGLVYVLMRNEVLETTTHHYIRPGK